MTAEHAMDDCSLASFDDEPSMTKRRPKVVLSH